MYREESRLKVLQDYQILDTDPESSFDELAELAAHVLETNYAQINFADKQRIWTKASVGSSVKERSREATFCYEAVQKESGLLVVEDVRNDSAFLNHPVTLSNPWIRFYAAVVIKSANGLPLGTICVFDGKARTPDDSQIRSLKTIGKQVEAQLNLRLKEQKLEELLGEENRLNRKIINSLPVNFFMHNSRGEMIRWNDSIRRTTGYSDLDISEMKPRDYFSVEDRSKVDSAIDHTMETGEAALEADLLRKDGTMTPFIFSTSRFRSNQETYLIGTGQDISEQKRFQEELQKSLREKEVLLAEVHHRVNNNLAIISGLIELEMMHSNGSPKGDHLRNTQQRIRSIALIHEILYKTESFSKISFDNVIERIIGFICNRYKNLTDGIEYRTNVEPMTLNVNQAIPCALIINELLTNASKHAFPRGRRGVVEVELTNEEHKITLRVADNGRGLPDTYGPTKSQTMGFMLVETLCKQLKANIETKRANGTEFIITFMKKEVKGTGSTLLEGSGEKLAS